MLNVFGTGISGISVYPADARALSEQEIANYQLSLQTQQAVPSYESYRMLANYRPYPEKPLDERFADFKIRLAETIAKRSAGR